MSIKTEEEEIKLKGKVSLIAFSLFVVGALIDYLFITKISNIIARLRLVISSISFYIGFILPKWAKKILLKS